MQIWIKLYFNEELLKYHKIQVELQCIESERQTCLDIHILIYYKLCLETQFGSTILAL